MSSMVLKQCFFKYPTNSYKHPSELHINDKQKRSVLHLPVQKVFEGQDIQVKMNKYFHHKIVNISLPMILSILSH